MAINPQEPVNLDWGKVKRDLGLTDDDISRVNKTIQNRFAECYNKDISLYTLIARNKQMASIGIDIKKGGDKITVTFQGMQAELTRPVLQPAQPPAPQAASQPPAQQEAKHREAEIKRPEVKPQQPVEPKRPEAEVQPSTGQRILNFPNPKDKDLLYKELGLSPSEVNALIEFIGKYAIRTNKKYEANIEFSQGKYLPRSVQFYEDGRIAIELKGGEPGCNFKPGDIYFPLTGDRFSQSIGASKKLEDLRQVVVQREKAKPPVKQVAEREVKPPAEQVAVKTSQETQKEQKIDLKFPGNKDALYRELGLSPSEVDILIEFMREHVTDLGTNKRYADIELSKNKWLPRPVQFHADGRISIELLGGEAGCNFKPGDIYYPLSGDRFSQSTRSLKKLEGLVPQVMEVKKRDETKPVAVRFTTNDDDLFSIVGMSREEANLLTTSIENNYSKYATSGRKFTGDQLGKWLPADLTFLPDGKVIVELDKAHLRDKGLVYEVLSGKRYKAVEMNESAWNAIPAAEKAQVAFYYKTQGRDGKEIIRALYNDKLTSSTESSALESKSGIWKEPPRFEVFLYGRGYETQERSYRNITFPTADVNWTSINIAGSDDIGPKRTFEIDPVTKKTVVTATNEPQPYFRDTSKFWRSDYIENISGIEFRASLKNHQLGVGNRLNHFAIFFHRDKFYQGNVEYGASFREGSGVPMQFYLEQEANQRELPSSRDHTTMIENPNYEWKDWPKAKEGGGGLTVHDEGVGDLLMQNTDDERFFRIFVLKNGDFHLQITNPTTNETKTCTVSKPEQFPNLHNASGYITINALKIAPNDDVKIPRELNVRDVKIWKANA